ncbi:M1 family aminopeptidase [Saprospiraceae bacterium]|jgi:ABC-2 type transport system permease protein|nr:hypothetical protein [Bacteroidota bacterium]MDB4727290.1 M1 family aminopeptidase [Saprospiraceae bacterium]
MFSTIYKYELKHWVKQPAIYIYAIFFLLFSWAAGTGNSEPPEASWSGRMLDSSIELFKTIGFFDTFIALLLPAILGLTIYRDYRSNMHQILYAYPFEKRDYLFAKYLSGLTASFGVVSMIGLGVYISSFMSWINPESVFGFNLRRYGQIFGVFVLPNILLVGTIVFVVVGVTRNIYAGFIAVIIWVLLRESLGNIFSPMDYPTISAILDSSGKNSIDFYTNYWTVAERNANLLPLHGLVLWNRVFWMVIAAVIFTSFYRKFSFSQNADFGLRLVTLFQIFKPKTNSLKGNDKLSPNRKIQKINLSEVSFDFSLFQQLKTTWYLTKADFKYIVKHPPFVLLIIAGFFTVIFMVSKGMMRWDTSSLPLTRIMLDLPLSMFSAVINIVTFLYAGLLINRGRMAFSNQLIDITPTPNWVLFFSKFIAIILIQITLLSLIMFGGILTQFFKGYYEFEIGQYIIELFGVNLIHFIIWAMLAMLIQSLFTNPYLGFFICLLAPVGFIGLADLGPKMGLPLLESGIFRYNQGLGSMFGLPYSDLDGYGGLLSPYFAYKFYWFLGGSLLMGGAMTLWIRGLPHSFSERLSIAKSRFSGKLALAFSLFLISFLGMGFTLYYQETIPREYYSHQEKMDLLVAAEKKYKRYQNIISPHIVSVKMNMDLYPKERHFDGSGKYILVNHSEEIIDTIVLNYKSQLNQTYDFECEYEFVSQEEIGNMAHFDIVKLKEGLKPNDTLKMTFQMKSMPQNWFHINNRVKYNGTYINDEICPRFGYWLGYLREEIGMNYDIKMPHPTDTLAIKELELRKDSKMIDFEAIVSTSDDQIAISPGALLREWAEKNRRYFHYKTETKISHSFLFMSGEFDVAKDKWRNIDLEVYYRKGHEYNVQRMMDGMKAGLEFCNDNFSPYQFNQLKIVEFAQTGGVSAHGFPGVLPSGEGAGFTADLDGHKHEGVDWAFGTAVHEVAHQWWGHQVRAASAQGSKMIAESMAEYVNVCVKHKVKGKKEVRKYIKHEMDHYLQKRAREWGTEQPLMYTHPDQNYIHYPKGTVTFYALKEYLGQEKLNQAIGKFVKKVAFREEGFTTTPEMMNYIREATPDSLKYIIKDWFETVTLYDSKIVDAKISPLKNGQFQIDLDFQVSKYRSEDKGIKVFEDEKGASISYHDTDKDETIQSLPLADYIEIGILNGDKELYLKKHKVTQIKNQISLIVDEYPTEVGIDIFGLLIDVKRADNLKKF